MQSSIFADESGDESADKGDAGDAPASERGTGGGSVEYRTSSDGRRSIFRNRTTTTEASRDDGERASDGDAHSTDDDALNENDANATDDAGPTDDVDGIDAGERSSSTMTVFSGDDVYEIGVDDA